jgi:hypothetical protein
MPGCSAGGSAQTDLRALGLTVDDLPVEQECAGGAQHEGCLVVRQLPRAAPARQSPLPGAWRPKARKKYAAQCGLPPMLARLREQHSLLTLELVVSNWNRCERA